MKFDARVAIVTGAGRGPGRAYAKELAKRRAAVVVHDSGVDVHGEGHNPSPALLAVDEIVAAGGAAVACTSDASTQSGAEEAVDIALDSYSRLDVVVANAGILIHHAYPEWPAHHFETVLRHHLLSAFHVTRRAFEEMKRARYGRLVFVSSAAGVFGQPNPAETFVPTGIFDEIGYATRRLADIAGRPNDANRT